MTFSRRLSQLSPVLFAAHILCLLVGVHGASVLQAYRLVQYDHQGTPLGSRTVRLAQYATLKREGATLFRSVVLLPLKDATVQLVKEILDPAVGLAGLVFLMPATPAPLDFWTDTEIELFLELEKLLLLQAISIPVYFLQETPDLNAIMASIQDGIDSGKPPTSIHGGYLLQIKSSSAKALKKPAIANYEGWLMGSEGGKSARAGLPTVVISAHYDDFSSAPGMPGGGNGSGVVALISLLRFFGSLYKEPSTRPPFNLLFLLTGGGGMNYIGLQEWIKTTETRVLDSIEFVISLDALSGIMVDNEELYFHYSKPPKDPLVTDWYSRFEKAAELEGVTLKMTHKKINLALPYMAWEHEHLAQHKMLGATLSGLKEGNDPMFRTSLLDTAETMDRETLMKAIKIVGSAISMRLYETEGRDFGSFGNLSGVLPGTEREAVRKWLRAMTTIPKMAPFMTKDDGFGAALMKLLNAHTDKGISSLVPLSPDYVFYDGVAFEMGVYKTAGVLIDLLLIGGVLTYLGVLFISLRVATQGWAAFISLFQPSQPKWKKPSGGKNMAHKLMGSGKK